MNKRKEILKLEAILDKLEQSKPVVSHNPVETEVIINRIIDYQKEYKNMTGHYYSPNKGKDKYGR